MSFRTVREYEEMLEALQTNAFPHEGDESPGRKEILQLLSTRLRAIKSGAR